jgi:hypothetical protein
MSNKKMSEFPILAKLRLRLRLRRKKLPEITCSQGKIQEVQGVFLNLSLNLNLAILKMRIAVEIFLFVLKCNL